MLRDFLENLRGRSKEHKLALAFVATFMTAVILIPIWLWNMSQYGFGDIQGVSTTKAEEPADISQSLDGLPNPAEQFNKELTSRLSNPVSLDRLENIGANLVVSFSVSNGTFADLIFPTSNVSVVAMDGTTFQALRTNTTDGKQFVPVIPPGETRKGALYFEKIFNGKYYLKFPGLHYQDQEGEFEQSIDIQVKDALLPRS